MAGFSPGQAASLSMSFLRKCGRSTIWKNFGTGLTGVDVAALLEEKKQVIFNPLGKKAIQLSQPAGWAILKRKSGNL